MKAVFDTKSDSGYDDEIVWRYHFPTQRLRSETMSNGEVRIRLLDELGLGYIRTQASERGGWQSSHFHDDLRETYIVQAGWAAVAQLDAVGGLELSRLEPCDVWTATPGRPHNIYLAPGTVTHVIKHGVSTGDDWRTDAMTERLDALSKIVPASSLENLARANSR